MTASGEADAIASAISSSRACSDSRRPRWWNSANHRAMSAAECENGFSAFETISDSPPGAHGSRAPALGDVFFCN